MPAIPNDETILKIIVSGLFSVIGLLVAIIGFGIKYIVSSFNGRLKAQVIFMDKQEDKLDKLDHEFTILSTEHKKNHQ